MMKKGRAKLKYGRYVCFSIVCYRNAGVVEGGPVYKTICVDKVEKEEEEKWVRGVEAFCIVTYAESGGLAGATNKTAKTADARISTKKNCQVFASRENKGYQISSKIQEERMITRLGLNRNIHLRKLSKTFISPQECKPAKRRKQHTLYIIQSTLFLPSLPHIIFLSRLKSPLRIPPKAHAPNSPPQSSSAYPTFAASYGSPLSPRWSGHSRTLQRTSAP